MTSKLTCSLGWDEHEGSDPAAGAERKLGSKAVAKGCGNRRLHFMSAVGCRDRPAGVQSPIRQESTVAVSSGGVWTSRQPAVMGNIVRGSWTPALSQGPGQGASLL